LLALWSLEIVVVKIAFCMASNTLRRFFNVSPDSLSAVEEATVSRLAAASGHAATQDIRNPGGVDSCAAYLQALEAAATELKIPASHRSYRASFPLNYRSLFPSEARSYRVDILEASLEHYNVIWVNGKQFEFSAEATQRAEELQVAWIDLGKTLERWNRLPRRASSSSPSRPTRHELTSVLQSLDNAWASFEESYITELVQIESESRSHIVQAIALESELKQLEVQHGNVAWTLPNYQEVQRSLCMVLSHLNSVANVNRKGRDDLRVEVLREANLALIQCNATGSVGNEAGSLLTATKILATDVVDSFEAIRVYLREVANQLERVDPHLGNNCGLVARLVDWEESWEIGTAYLQQKKLLHALCDAVAEIQRVRLFAPKLADMCEECDVELFMVLPRLIWLRFLAEPLQQMPLLVRFLPHRFVAGRSEIPTLCQDLRSFSEKYSQTECALASLCGSTGCVPETKSGPNFYADARELLVKRGICGSGDEADNLYAAIPHRHVDEAKTLVEELMHELEAWSIELQRHCPEDWNQYSAVLVHCLSTETETDRKGPFFV